MNCRVSRELAVLDGATLASLDSYCFRRGPRENAANIIGDADTTCYERALQVLLVHEQSDTVFVLHFPTVAKVIVNAVTKARDDGGRNNSVLTCWPGEDADKDARKIFEHSNAATPCSAISRRRLWPSTTLLVKSTRWVRMTLQLPR
jgi:acyl-CoA synthetase (NDP forming)